MEEKAKKGTPILIWVLIVALIIIAGFAIWYFTKGSGDSTATTEETQEVVTTPDGWQTFNSIKYGFTVSYPADYTLAEGATGTIKMSKDSVEMVDLYVYAANGSGDSMMASQEALFTDDSKGYMIADEVVQMTAAGEPGRIANGVFGKNAGVSQTHDGVTGSAVFFIKDDNQFTIDSYDKGDATAKENFQTILSTLEF